MGKLCEFIDYLNEQVASHGIYVWGGQGQKAPTITKAWIRSMENSPTNANRAIAFWQKQVAAGYGGVLRAFDCSGLGIYWLCDKMKLLPYDLNADTLMTDRCSEISRSELCRGDWVFRVNSAGRAYHIGYVVDDALRVVEAKGRDDGVVKRALSASGSGYWNRYGRPAVFRAEILAGKGATAADVLRYGDMGEAVKAMQQLLLAAGYDCGSCGADGEFGTQTLGALTRAQKALGVAVDGLYGPATKAALEAATPTPGATPGAPADMSLGVGDMRMVLRGDRGDDVTLLQQLLIAAGYACGNCGADGVFGAATQAAVTRYQKSKGLQADGIAGPKTWGALLGK
jgi:peptidoglycan hydrolase-like protein with peptidoglycan-binding domain